MNHQAANVPVNSGLAGINEAEVHHACATKALYENISALMTLLAGFLKVNIDAGITPLPITDKFTVLAFIVTAVIYYVSLAVKDEDGDPDLAKLMQMVSLLSGPLALVLEVVIIFPAFRMVGVMVWIVWFLVTVAKSYKLIASVVKRMYRSAVEEFVHVFDKLKDLFRNYVTVG